MYELRLRRNEGKFYAFVSRIPDYEPDPDPAVVALDPNDHNTPEEALALGLAAFREILNQYDLTT